MAGENIGERIAALKADFKSFKEQILSDNQYVKERLDKIIEILGSKVDKTNCQAKHEKIDERLTTFDKSNPAIIQSIIVALTTGGVMTIVSYIISHIK